VVRRLYSTGGMAGGVLASMNNAILEIVKRDFAFSGTGKKLIPCYRNIVPEKNMCSFFGNWS